MAAAALPARRAASNANDIALLQVVNSHNKLIATKAGVHNPGVLKSTMAGRPGQQLTSR
jgi:hypothetical protein